MKALSEKELAEFAREGAEITDVSGGLVVPFKWPRDAERAKKPKQNRFGMYLAQIIATMRETLEERKATRSVLEKIASTLAKPAPKSPIRTDGYVFTVRRDSRGFITEIEAKRG